MDTLKRPKRVKKASVRPYDAVEHAHQSARPTLSTYLKEIGKAKLLTADQEKKLARRIKKGDEEARQEFIEANLRLVVSVAKRYASARDPEMLLDLIQEGNLGLFRAVDRFKPQFKTRFSTYGTYWIRQAIQRSLGSHRTVRLPENVLADVRKMRRVRHELYQHLGRQPTSHELAIELEVKDSHLQRLEQASQDTVSLDQPIKGTEDDETRLGELLEDIDAPQPEMIVSQHLLHGQVRDTLTRLPQRQQKVLRLRFGLDDGHPKTLEEIGQEFGISRERVRQIQNDAFSRIRSHEKSLERLR